MHSILELELEQTNNDVQCSNEITITIINMGRKFRGRAGSPSNTLSPWPRPTGLPSFILIRPTVWPQCTNVTDRTNRQRDRQRSDSIGRTVLQTVAQKRLNRSRCSLEFRVGWVQGTCITWGCRCPTGVWPIEKHYLKLVSARISRSQRKLHAR